MIFVILVIAVFVMSEWLYNIYSKSIYIIHIVFQFSSPSPPGVGVEDIISYPLGSGGEDFFALGLGCPEMYPHYITHQWFWSQNYSLRSQNTNCSPLKKILNTAPLNPDSNMVWYDIR